MRETGGSVENFGLLEDPASGVVAAFVQGGVAPGGLGEVRSVGSLYYEPVWIFYRGDVSLGRLEDLSGMVVAAGGEGSGVRLLFEALLEETGMVAGQGEVEGRAEVRIEPLGGDMAKQALVAGDVDAAVFVISPTSPLVRTLLEAPGIQVMNLELAEAYRRRMPYLARVVLPKGALDLGEPLPGEDLVLLATTANLVVRGDVHAALVPLLIEAAREVHSGGGLLSDAGIFPSLGLGGLPSHPAAESYYEQGASFLFRLLPFWVASWIDRWKIFLLPLLTLLLPMFRIAPPLYRWRIRRRIYRWYRVLKGIEDELSEPGREVGIEEDIASLNQLDREVNSTLVPLPFMQEFYQLRMHIAMTRERLVDASVGE